MKYVKSALFAFTMFMAVLIVDTCIAEKSSKKTVRKKVLVGETTAIGRGTVIIRGDKNNMITVNGKRVPKSLLKNKKGNSIKVVDDESWINGKLFTSNSKPENKVKSVVSNTEPYNINQQNVNEELTELQQKFKAFFGKNWKSFVKPESDSNKHLNSGKTHQTIMKQKSKNKVNVSVGSIKLGDGSTITIGGSGKSIKGKVVINDIVIPDESIKGKKSDIRVENNRVWIDGKEVDLTAKSKPVKTKELTEKEATKLRTQLRNFFGKN